MAALICSYGKGLMFRHIQVHDNEHYRIERRILVNYVLLKLLRPYFLNVTLYSERLCPSMTLLAFNKVLM